MSIHFQCPHCQKSYRVDDKYASRTVTCRKCETKIKVPVVKSPAAENGTATAKTKTPAEAKTPTGVKPTASLKQSASRKQAAADHTKAHQLIRNHLHAHVGPLGTLMEDPVSDGHPVSIQIIPPNQINDFQTVVTVGMSDRELPQADSVPFKYMELMMFLPPDFDLGPPEGNWPIVQLGVLANMPFATGTPFAPGQTIANSDPPSPIHPSSKACHWALIQALLMQDDFHHLKLIPDKSVSFLWALPIYSEEFSFQQSQGLGTLVDQLVRKMKIKDLVRLDRRNVCAKKALFSRR